MYAFTVIILLECIYMHVHVFHNNYSYHSRLCTRHVRKAVHASLYMLATKGADLL